MEIRALVERDLPQIKELDLLTFPPEEQYGDRTYVRMLQSGLSRVAIEINRVVGYAFVQINPYTHVRSLAVHPAFRRRGYGTALLRAVIKTKDSTRSTCSSTKRTLRQCVCTKPLVSSRPKCAG